MSGNLWILLNFFKFYIFSVSPLRKGIQLPPISVEGSIQNNEKFDVFANLKRTKTNVSSFSEQDAISIKEKIKELKSVTNKRLRSWSQNRSVDLDK